MNSAVRIWSTIVLWPSYQDLFRQWLLNLAHLHNRRVISTTFCIRSTVIHQLGDFTHMQYISPEIMARMHVKRKKELNINDLYKKFMFYYGLPSYKYLPCYRWVYCQVQPSNNSVQVSDSMSQGITCTVHALFSVTVLQTAFFWRIKNVGYCPLLASTGTEAIPLQFGMA